MSKKETNNGDSFEPFRWGLKGAGMGGNYTIQGEKVGLHSEKRKFNESAPEKSQEEFIVRTPKEKQHDHKHIVLGLKLLAELENDYKVHVPWRAAVEGEKTYIVTKRVDGEDLFEALRHPDERVVKEFQELMVSWINYLNDKRTQGGKYLHDHIGQHQYVYGRTPENSELHVYLVDLDFDVLEARVGDPESMEAIYNRFHWIAIETRLAEERSGQLLSVAREALEGASKELPKEVRENIRKELYAEKGASQNDPEDVK